MHGAIFRRLGPIAILSLTLLASSSGCGARQDPVKARAVVEIALNSWKNAEDAAQLANQGIEITEPDWQDGHRLLDYSVKDATLQPQQGPRVVVVLKLEDQRGMKFEIEVAYEVIATDKTQVKIGRDAFHVP